MKNTLAFYFVFYFVVILFAGCSGSSTTEKVEVFNELPIVEPAFKFSPAEQAELDKCIREHGTKAIIEYVVNKQYPGVDNERLLEGVKYLLSQGASVQLGLGGTVQTRHVNVAEFLINQGGDINMNNYGTSLHDAVTAGQLEMVKFLISKGADINAKNNHGETPLDIAKARPIRGKDAIIEYLSSLQK